MALEPRSPDRLSVADIALQVLVQDVFICGVFQDEEVFLGLFQFENAPLTKVDITLSRLKPLGASFNLPLTCITAHRTLPINIVLAQLISKGEPSFS